ncbi:hypothetical protein VP1G_05183 [Cytospora mali]|uniref:Cell surface protein n=1 Tax=Cytospora mali TaxID=578113 RepID=A0A194V1Y4_CYTMA|nr:hypothetical protein VP1G_05183 [Valsa mali var. pyri (nom. inval.)]
MLCKTFLLTLAATGLVAAHGRVDVVTGDAGGNGTALGIQGAVVPLTGSNRHTEVDTTVFDDRKVASDGLGKTKDTGDLDTSTLKQAMALSGSTLPQVKSALSGTWHVVTSDGFGSVKAVLDPTGEGKFSDGIELETTTDVPGDDGDEPDDFQETSNGKRKRSRKSVFRRFAESTGLIQKRAHNINADFPMAFSVPAGTTCSGTIEGQENVCLVKIANENDNGPFGGVVAIQMAGASNSTAKARSFRA